jgi:FkbM family methyltransferase
MKLALFRFLFAHRAIPQRIVGFFFRRPHLVQLDGFAMFIHLDDFAVSLGIAIRRGYERHLTRRMLRYLTPGAVFVDVGANIGYYTLLAASRIRPSGRVVAFEPNGANVVLLGRSLRHNGFDGVTIIGKALSDRDGLVAFGTDDTNGEISLTSDARHPMQVETVRADDVLAAEPRIDVVKMDIEGAEALALRGMTEVLRRHRPILFVEFSPEALRVISGVEPAQLLDLLRDHGYGIAVVDDSDEVRLLSNAEIMARFVASGSDHLDLQAVPQQ